MIKVKNLNQLNIFDPWAFLTPKRRPLLDSGWPGLFREHILPSIPVNKVGKYFNATFGRPTKELYSMLGALILQQTFDLTDEETVQQYAFNIQWHYSSSENDAERRALLGIMPFGVLFFVFQRAIEDNFLTFDFLRGR